MGTNTQNIIFWLESPLHGFRILAYYDWLLQTLVWERTKKNLYFLSPTSAVCGDKTTFFEKVQWPEAEKDKVENYYKLRSKVDPPDENKSSVYRKRHA